LKITMSAFSGAAPSPVRMGNSCSNSKGKPSSDAIFQPPQHKALKLRLNDAIYLS